LNFFDYVGKFLSTKTDASYERIISGLGGGFKFVISLIKEIKELTKVSGSGFPTSMLVNTLEYLYQTIKQMQPGSLSDSDQMSFMIDANLNEARTFLLSIIEDSTSVQRAVELSVKMIFLLGLARSSIEDFLIVINLLDNENLKVDLREEIQLLKVESGKTATTSSTESHSEESYSFLEERKIIKE